MKKNLIETFFRGERDYVHSTDLFLQTMQALFGREQVDIQAVDFRFHSPLAAQVELVTSNNTSSEFEESDVQLKFNRDGEDYFCHYVPTSNAPLRQPIFNETIVQKSANWVGDNVKIACAEQVSLIEKIVFLNKIFVQKNTSKKDYWFCLLRAPKFCGTFSGEVELSDFFEAKNGTTRTSIFIEGENIGTVYFKVS